MNRSTRAVVLGGGSFAASAWEIGLISGMATAGLDLRFSDLFIGTSAGARVGLFLASGVDIEELFQKQLRPLTGIGSMPASVNPEEVRAEYARAKAGGGDSAAILRRVGALALAVTKADTGDRRKTMAAQIPVQDWPSKNLKIVTVNAETGERRAFDRTSGAALVDVMVATTASIGSPPAIIHGQAHIDGGYYSSDNSDLAAGFEHVIVLALRPPRVGSLALVSLAEGVSGLRATGSRVQVIQPDEQAMTAFASVGSRSSPAVRGPAARAGRVQGRKLIEEGRLSLA